MKKSKNNKGITLITLAITIIVILILAGISVATLFGENGLFKSALTAKEKTEIASYQEIINLSTTYAHTNNKETNPEEILKKIKEELQKEEKFKEAKITGPDKNEEEQKLIIVTKEGYVFYVYEENNKYIGKKEEIGETELNIEIKEGHIKYTYKPSEWTNQDVEVGIEITKEEYKQYQIEYTYTPKENNSWKEYKEGEIVEKTNGRTIYARLTNGLSATKIYVAGTITNIDKDKPTIGQITNNLPIVIGNTGKIEVKEIKDPGGSELKGYYVSTKDEVPTKESVTWQPNTSSSFEYPVTEAGTYNIWVIDNAGNVSDKKTCMVTILDKATDVLTINDSAEEESEKSPYVMYNNILCRVLYDNSSSYGLQIVTQNNMPNNIKLGTLDPNVKSSDFDSNGWPSAINDEFKKASASYNRFGLTMQEEAEKYIDTQGIAKKARSLGSDPLYVADDTQKIWGTYKFILSHRWAEGDYIVPDLEEKYKLDVEQVNKLGLKENTGAYTILASRHVGETGNGFWLNYQILMSGGGTCTGLFAKLSDYTTYYHFPGYEIDMGFRPVFSLGPNAKIIDGKGTKDEPYVLGL